MRGAEAKARPAGLYAANSQCESRAPFPPSRHDARQRRNGARRLQAALGAMRGSRRAPSSSKLMRSYLMLHDQVVEGVVVGKTEMASAAGAQEYVALGCVKSRCAYVCRGGIERLVAVKV